MKHLLALGLGACLLPGLAKSEPVEFRYGFDVFEETQGTLDAFHSLSAMRELSPGLRFGQTLYLSLIHISEPTRPY